VATFQQRGDKWRAIVRRKGFKAKTRTFPTKSGARAWAERTERELADREARGSGDFDGATLRDLVDWYRREIGLLKRVTATQKGNLTRVVEGLGDKLASKLQVADIVEHARRRCQGEHVIKDGKRIPPCSPATMNVELGYLAEVLRVARSMGKLSIERDVVADSRPTLRLVKLVGKSRKRDRRPTDDELDG
jgi:hypothetical protein